MRTEKTVLELQKWLRSRPPTRRNWPVIVQNKNCSAVRIISITRKGMKGWR